MEASLVREIAKDANEFPAKNKLKLLRIVKAFAETEMYHMGLALTGAQVADDLLVHVLGGPNRLRATMQSLLHPHSSPIVAAQAKLLQLLQDLSAPGFPERPAENGSSSACSAGRLTARNAEWLRDEHYCNSAAPSQISLSSGWNTHHIP